MTLTDIEINNISKNISNYFYWDNIEATKQLIKLFDQITKIPLGAWQEYVKLYDNHFYTYSTFKELVESELDQSDGLTEKQCRRQLNKSIWRLPCGWYVQYV